MWGQTRCAMAVNQQSTIVTMERAVRQLEGIPKGSPPVGTSELAEPFHPTKAKRRMLTMGPAREHKHPPKARRSNTLCLTTQRAVHCNAGRGQGKGWVLLGKAWEAPWGGKALEIAEAEKSPSKVNGLPAGASVEMVLQLTSSK